MSITPRRLRWPDRRHSPAEASKTLSRYATGTTFILILAAGLILWTVESARTRPLRSVITGANRTSLVTGEVAGEIDQRVESHHPFHRPALQAITAARFVLFREGTGAVVIGENNRLFTLEEFERHPDDHILREERIEEIRRVAAELARFQQELVVVLLPSKARVLEPFLPPRWRSLSDHERWTAAVHDLRENKIHLIAPLSVLQESPSDRPAFLRFDTHWTPAGARAVARDVAEYVDRHQLLSGAPRQRFVGHERDEVLHTGDLVQFVPLPEFLARRIVPAESIIPVRSEEVGEAGGGLFDLPEIPIVLIGTSFSAGPLWSFPEFLKVELGADVLDLSEEGRGPFAPMRRYLDEGPPEGVTPALVIWEIPERYLTLPEEP